MRYWHRYIAGYWLDRDYGDAGPPAVETYCGINTSPEKVQWTKDSEQVTCPRCLELMAKDVAGLSRMAHALLPKTQV